MYGSRGGRWRNWLDGRGLQLRNRLFREGLVPGEGFEPSCPFEHSILSAARIPFRHPGEGTITASLTRMQFQPEAAISLRQLADRVGPLSRGARRACHLPRQFFFLLPHEYQPSLADLENSLKRCFDNKIENKDEDIELRQSGGEPVTSSQDR